MGEIGWPGRKARDERHKPFKHAAKVFNGVATEDELEILAEFSISRPERRFEKLETQKDELRDYSILHGWRLFKEKDMREPCASASETTARETYWKVMERLFKKAQLPSRLDRLGGSNSDQFELYWVDHPSLLRTREGAEDQEGHRDLPTHSWKYKEEKGLQLSCILPTQNDRSITFVMDNGRKTTLVVRPGDALLFRTDVCHYGNGCGEALPGSDDGKKNRYAWRTAIHAFLLCHEETEELMDTHDKGCGCGVTRTLTMKTLGDPEKFPKRMENGDFSLPVGGQKKEWRQMANGKEPTCEKPDMLNRGTSLVCQLCRALEVEDCDGTIYTGRKSGLVHCKDCRLVLCQHACWQRTSRQSLQCTRPDFRPV